MNKRFAEMESGKVKGNSLNEIEAGARQAYKKEKRVERMHESYYLEIFQKAAHQLDKKSLNKKQLEIATGTVLESVCLKLYKLSWANKTSNPLTSPSRIFFSVWVSDKSIKENKLLYNIHALKLRELKGYTITSREFATAFRKAFKPFEKHWPNVSTNFGPLTLMEGWMKLSEETLQDDISKLAKQFLKIDGLIDELLQQNRK